MAPSRACGHCNRTGHPTEVCPLKAAELRNETTKALADSARTGRCCTICGYGDHREDHHRLGSADAAYNLAGGNASKVSWMDSSGNRKGFTGGASATQGQSGGGNQSQQSGGGSGRRGTDGKCRVCGKPKSEHFGDPKQFFGRTHRFADLSPVARGPGPVPRPGA